MPRYETGKTREEFTRKVEEIGYHITIRKPYVWGLGLMMPATKEELALRATWYRASFLSLNQPEQGAGVAALLADAVGYHGGNTHVFLAEDQIQMVLCYLDSFLAEARAHPESHPNLDALLRFDEIFAARERGEEDRWPFVVFATSPEKVPEDCEAQKELYRRLEKAAAA